MSPAVDKTEEQRPSWTLTGPKQDSDGKKRLLGGGGQADPHGTGQ